MSHRNHVLGLMTREPAPAQVPDIALLLAEAVELTDLAARLNDRTASWREWNDEWGDCPDKQEAAAEEAALAAQQAWGRLEAAEALTGGNR
jgi:hypothetical protein